MFFFIVCLFHSRLLLAAANQIILYLSHMILQQTHQMLCVAASLRSSLCCVAPVTTDFPKLALCSQVCRSRYNFDGFFFVLLCRSQNVCKNSFFFFYSANAWAALLRCHSLNAMCWCWKCCDIVLNVTGTHCVWSKQNVQNWSSGSPATVACLLQSLCVCDSSNSGFYFFLTDLDDAAAGCASHCVAAFFLSTKAQWEHRGDATFSPSHRHVQLRMYWECADSLVLCLQYQSNLLQWNKNTLLEIQHLTFKLATMSRFRTWNLNSGSLFFLFFFSYSAYISKYVLILNVSFHVFS